MPLSKRKIHDFELFSWVAAMAFGSVLTVVDVLRSLFA